MQRACWTRSKTNANAFIFRHFSSKFKELQTEFIDKTRADLEIELNRFEKKSEQIQTHVNDLKGEVDRIEKVDLEIHFSKLQKTLSDIFGSVNSINLTLTDLTKNFTHITSELGSIDSKITKNQHSLVDQIETTSNQTLTHLSNQDKESKVNAELLSKKFSELSNENQQLKKTIKTSSSIQFIGIGIILIGIIYLIIK